MTVTVINGAATVWPFALLQGVEHGNLVAVVYQWSQPAMTMLSRWGNSLGLRLPKYVTERAALQAGDHVYVRLLDSGEILVRIARAKDIPDVFRPLEGDGVPVASRPITDEDVAQLW
jgi:antitoxin component of MazEF toxin-antitoxin module